jgi:serine/threonine protein phosphatase 1
MIKSQYGFKIEKCKGNQLVIPDVHGCLKTLQTLINKIKLTANDQLFLLGDLIDRGPESLGVLQFVAELMRNTTPL